MNKELTSLLVYFLILGVLRISTRKSKNDEILKQWKSPYLLLLRLAVLVLLFHWIFASLQIHPLKGYLFLAVFILASFASLWLSVLVVFNYVVCWLFYEWIFWFPCKKDMIHCGVSVESEEKEDLTSIEAIITSDLKPLGKILIKGKEVVAKINHGTANVGEKVIVIDSCGFEYLVEKTRD